MFEAWIDNLRAALFGAAGTANIASSRPGQARLSFMVRVLRTVIGEACAGQLSLRAMGLVYTTLLSLVPLLAVSFSVLKAFGVHNQLEGALLNLLAPLGEQGLLITEQIVSFVENMKVGALGSLGLALLMYTVISLMQKIESAVNHTWRIRRTRGLVDRFSRYLSVVLVGPVLVFSAMGIFASLLSSSAVQQMMALEPFGALIRYVVGILPYLLVIGAFSFVYAYTPNTRVKIGPAVTGGVVAGLLWTSVGWAFAAFIVGSTTKWTAVYSSMAILMVFMVWLYVGWVVLLTGASVAFYVQNPHYLGLNSHALHLGGRVSERVGLQAMRLIAKRFLDGAAPWQLSNLSAQLNVPIESLRGLLQAMSDAGLLTRLGGEHERFLPAKDLQCITVLDILSAVRAPHPDALLTAQSLPNDTVTEAITSDIDAALSSAGAQTLRELALPRIPLEVASGGRSGSGC